MTGPVPTWTPLPPAEAIKFFREKGFKIAFDPLEVSAEEHARAFTVARMMRLDLLSTVKDAVDASIADGTSFATFKKNLTPTLQAAGWWGEQTVTNPTTGKDEIHQLGSPRRLQTIFETNQRTAYAAGRWSQIEETQKTHPNLRYVGSTAEHKREEHLQWAGLVLRADDPWWHTHFPPNGWGCKCSTQQLSDGAMKNQKLAMGHAPPMVMQPYTNPATGEVRRVPNGIDPGFGVNPGIARDITARNFLDKVTAADPTMGANAWHDAKGTLTPLVQRGFSQWVSPMLSGKGSAKVDGTLWTVGALSPSTVASLKAAGISPASAGITVTDRAMQHLFSDAKTAHDAAASVEQLALLPTLLAQPAAVLRDTRDQSLLYVFATPSDDTRGKLVVRLNVQANANVAGKPGVLISNAVRTAGLVPLAQLKDPAFYTLVEGTL